MALIPNALPPAHTIELIEAIGKDASLRYASPDELLQALIAAKATEGLKQASLTGDLAYLWNELGRQGRNAVQVPAQTPTQTAAGQYQLVQNPTQTPTQTATEEDSIA